MGIITREEAIKNLRKYIGKDLMSLAKEHGVTTYETGRQNKGWKGLLLEKLAGLDSNNKKAPNGETFELKSVAFYYVKGKLIPKETMAIGMINPEEIKQKSFFESHYWAKLKSLIFCAVMWHGKNAKNAELIAVANLDFLETDVLIKEIEADYNFVKEKLIRQGFDSLSGRDGKWIQPRTKGPGHGSISRAFYARKTLIKEIFEIKENK